MILDRLFGRALFRYLDGKGIEPVIKVRRNASLKARGCMPRKLVVVEQLKDYKRWKHGYGHRWIAESAISSFTIGSAEGWESDTHRKPIRLTKV